VRRAGPTPLVVREYLNSGLATTGSGGSVLSGGPVKVRTVRVVNDASRQQDAPLVGDVLRIEVEFEVTEDAPGMDLAVIVTTAAGVRVLDELLSEGASVRLRRGAYRVALPIPPLLNAGEYTVGLWFGTQHEDFVNEPVGAAPFTVHRTGANRPERLLALGLPFEVHRIEG
jgi:hypothetical protein